MRYEIKNILHQINIVTNLLNLCMDTKQKIEEAQTVLDAGGNVIKTRDDRELILVDKDGKVQNADACGWLPDTSEVNKTIFRSRIELMLSVS